MSELRRFYEREYQGELYGNYSAVEEHAFYPVLKAFIEKYNLKDKKCLEVGCGRGAFQDLIRNYTGVDIAFSVHHYVHKPFITASATELPFADSSFDVLWTVTVLEHVPDPERALGEIWRVLKPGGYLFLAPSWQCRSWSAEGYPVRPYRDFNLLGKLTKASIPIRNSVAYRAITVIPKRLVELIRFKAYKKPLKFKYKTIKPNYEKYWMSDGDAVNSMDPIMAYYWFISRNGICLNINSLSQSIFFRTGPLVFLKSKNPE